ncbi:MAG: 2-C-methyl-D-erythritol 4-phosphate cytidylyltransferase, partial [Methylophilus sp.]
MAQAIFGIVLAAGSGERFGAATPKQYYPIAGKTVLEHAIQALLALDKLEKLIVVLARHDAYWTALNFHHPKL